MAIIHILRNVPCPVHSNVNMPTGVFSILPYPVVKLSAASGLQHVLKFNSNRSDVLSVHLHACDSLTSACRKVFTVQCKQTEPLVRRGGQLQYESHHSFRLQRELLLWLFLDQHILCSKTLFLWRKLPAFHLYVCESFRIKKNISKLFFVKCYGTRDA